MNKTGEAYTENCVGHRGFRAPEVLVSPRQIVPIGQVCNITEASMKNSLLVRVLRIGGVIKPWHVQRDASGTWEIQMIPKGRR